MTGLVASLHRKSRVKGERGIPKPSVDALTITEAGVLGDYNRYRSERLKHDPNKAVLLLPRETLAALRSEGWDLAPGDLGENISTEGIAYDELGIGTRVRVGAALLAIMEPCTPCSNLRVLVGPVRAKALIRTLLGRRGWYARVLEGGAVHVGDVIVRAE